MKKLLALAILAVLALTLAVGCEVSTANLQDVQVCSDPNSDNMCESDESSFDANTEEIFVTGNLENAPDDTDLEITWTYLGEEGDDPEEIDSVSLSGSSATFYSNLEAPSSGWPAGEYEIVLDLGTDNSDPVTKTFTVEGDARPDPAGDDVLSELMVCDDATDNECLEDMKSFDVDVPVIYLSGAIGKVPTGTEITITWRYLGGEGGDEQDIDAIVLTSTESPNVFFSNLESPDDGWPVGDYEIVIDLDGKKEATKLFSVE